MNYTPTKGHLRVLKTSYEDACNNYLFALLNMWELNANGGYWIGDAVGEIYDYDGAFTISMQDIVFCVENSVSMEKYTEYVDYYIKCREYKFSCTNLPSYVKGCPTVPQETFDKLDDLKRRMEKCINDTNSKLDGTP